jgi:hypothetical protein
VVLYIDDGLLVGPSKARVIRRYKFALDVFDKAGLLISFQKGSTPEDASTRVEFLGVCINTERMCVFGFFAENSGPEGDRGSGPMVLWQRTGP